MKLAYPLLAVAFLVGCQSVGTSGGKQARAELLAKSGSSVAGSVNFTGQDGNKVLVEVKAFGLKPNSEHGFHVHEKGDCSAADATSTGGHFNPTKQPHGHPQSAQRHAGDMPNLKSDDKGQAITSFEITGVTLDKGPQGILQRGIIIHANPDDHTTQPTGNAGDRIACGVISKI